MKVAYLFSRYPVVSHTFCDTEILAHERASLDLEIDVIAPPKTPFRHAHFSDLRSPRFYLPPAPVVEMMERKARREGRYPEALVRDHEARFEAFLKPAVRFRNALFLADALKRRGVDHVHVHFANRAAYTALCVKAISGIPFSFTAHGQDFMVDLGSPLMLAELCKEAAFSVAVSQFSRNLLAQAAPASADKIHCIYNGVNLSYFPLRTPGQKNRVPHLVCTGRLIPLKGHDHLIAACALLRDRGLDFQCNIIGSGPFEETLRRDIETAGLGAQVHLTGSLPQERVLQLCSEADIFVLPSAIGREGGIDILPTVILEAMASSLPVVATDVGGVSEMFEHGHSGLLVPPNDPASLAAAIQSLLTQPELRTQLGQAARAVVEARFRVEQSSAALREHFAKHADQRQHSANAKTSTASTKTTASAAPQPAKAPSFAYLVPHWPTVPPDSFLLELETLKAEFPNMHLFIGRVASKLRGTPRVEALLSEAEFLPDAMVLEAELQQQAAKAARVAEWRADAGMEPEPFLEATRWALSLRESIESRGIGHLHVTSSAGLPCAWILTRLCGISMSATLGRDALETATSSLLNASTAVRVAPGRLKKHSGESSWEADFMPTRGRFAAWFAAIPFSPKFDVKKIVAWGERLQRWASVSKKSS